MAQATVPQEATATLALVEQVIEAAIFTGVYRDADTAYPVTWRMGVKLVQDGDRHTGYRLLLTALVGTPGAAQEILKTLLASL